jgi:hypothetical protein
MAFGAQWKALPCLDANQYQALILDQINPV